MSDKQTIRFNVNDHVRVRLTAHGKEVLKSNHDELFTKIGLIEKYPFHPPKEDADGWSVWQLWHLMHELGHATGMGLELCFDTTIEFVLPKD